MRKILVTGGAGFIGSHVFERLCAEYPTAHFTVLDKMTYAADFDNLAEFLVRGLRTLEVGDLCDLRLCTQLTLNCDCVVHLAAESHVDTSFGNSICFTQSNTLGTHSLLEACRINKVPQIIHVSTDEVYGETHAGCHVETDQMNPTNPYSASKAAAEMIVNSYIKSFNLPITVVRANNIFGIRQFPEKIIPRFSMQALSGQPFTIHGNGLNRRHYLAAPDFAEAIVAVIERGKFGEIYNIGSDEEYTNIDVRDMIAKQYGIDGEANTIYVTDRPFNDFRYAISSDKIKALGWKSKRRLADEIGAVTQWYLRNRFRYDHLFAREDESAKLADALA